MRSSQLPDLIGKKRFPWRLLACAVVLVLIAAVVGFIETVGREGTIIGRYEQVRDGMSKEQVVAILGPEQPSSWVGEEEAMRREKELNRTQKLVDIVKRVQRHIQGVDPSDGRLLDWAEWKIGPASVYVDFVANDWDGRIPRSRKDIARWSVVSKDLWLEFDGPPPIAWRLRCWAEQVYTAIHGPRR
jgi:hypothetical protein